MTQLYGVGLGIALLLGLGCATHSAVRTEVGDEALARIKPVNLGPVDRLRMEVGRANDEVARQRQESLEAEQDLQLARGEVEDATSQEKRIEQLQTEAIFERDRQAAHASRPEMDAAHSEHRLADAHVRSAQTLIDVRREDETIAREQAAYAQARLEWGKYEALRASGDPAAEEYAPGQLKNEIAAHEQRIREAQARRETKTQVHALAQQEMTAAREAAQQTQGVGGSGPADEDR